MQRIILAIIESTEKEKASLCVQSFKRHMPSKSIWYGGNYWKLIPSVFWLGLWMFSCWAGLNIIWRREKVCPGQPPRHPTTSQLLHHGQDMATLNGTPQGLKPWGQPFPSGHPQHKTLWKCLLSHLVKIPLLHDWEAVGVIYNPQAGLENELNCLSH